MKGDLHVHTNVSDGSCNIQEVLALAKEADLDAIAITNHDTVSKLEDAIKLGEEFDIYVIPGIEISAYDYVNNKKVHILGYNFNLDGEHIRELCDKTLELRRKNSKWQIDTLINHGYDITEEEVMAIGRKSTSIYKQHIMQALINKGYANKVYDDLYYELFKGDGICNRDINYVDVIKAVKAIKKDGGVAILAHPGQVDNYDIIPLLISVGLDGVEINHLSHDEDDIEKIKDISLEYGLVLTGGSDFHGEYGNEEINIGDFKCPSYFLKKLINKQSKIFN